MAGPDCPSRRDFCGWATVAVGATCLTPAVYRGQIFTPEYRVLLHEHLACMVVDWQTAIPLLRPNSHRKGMFSRIGPPPADFDPSLDGLLERLMLIRRQRKR